VSRAARLDGRRLLADGRFARGCAEENSRHPYDSIKMPNGTLTKSRRPQVPRCIRSFRDEAVANPEAVCSGELAEAEHLSPEGEFHDK
jgi:hypothetical protein